MKMRAWLSLLLMSFAAFACKPTEPVSGTPENAPMSFAPAVPPAITRSRPAHLIVNLAVTEEERPLADGVVYEFWSYNGHTPGPFIRLRVGDTFEVRLDNS